MAQDGKLRFIPRILPNYSRSGAQCPTWTSRASVFLFTTSDTRGRETIKISGASACLKCFAIHIDSSSIVVASAAAYH
jgi:hypothetical protein